VYPSFHPKENAETPFLFFTGKGGVGKTSAACATAISLADQGKKVLLVSTDPASNLQDVFEMELTNDPVSIPSVDNLFALNIDPEESARVYREKTVGPYRGKLPDSVIATMEEQLSGACTVEIAAFDEFSHLLSDENILNIYDHVVFDTAPTGHTLRLLELPTAWNGFLEESTHGASCLGPLSGLGDKKKAYAQAVQSLSDQEKTSLVLVSRPDHSSLAEANRASLELRNIGIQNQMLIINGLLQTHQPDDEVSTAFYMRQQNALKGMSGELKEIETFSLPYVSYLLTGVGNLRQWISDNPSVESSLDKSSLGTEKIQLTNLNAIIDDFSSKDTRVIFTMGKGGVGKTSTASAIAVGLMEKGHRVHLTTTDPAGHLKDIFHENNWGKGSLSISSINPTEEVEKYKKEVLSTVGQEQDDGGLAYLKEDLESPCTEEIAMFRAFAEVVEKSDDEIVVIDTAPTGHTLLLLDSTEAYHKEVSRSTSEVPASVKKLLPRLRNPKETGVVIVTLAEATPVLEANRLQEDLKRAGIVPTWWVINQSLYATDTTDPVLMGRAVSEKQWICKVKEDLSDQCALIPWMQEEKSSYDNLKEFINA